MGRLENKVALITAAGVEGGVGRTAALMFAREGARVVVTDIDAPSGEQTARLVKQAGGEAVFVKADVTSVADMETMVRSAVESYGKLDVLWNHAGAVGPFDIDSVSEEEFDRCLAVNCKGAFFACQHAIPVMRKAGGGSIIFTASVAGIVGVPSLPCYCLAKGGIVNLTRALALLCNKDNIRVNCIAPGGVATPGVMTFMPGKTAREREEQLKAATQAQPRGRLATPEEVAAVGLFLASEESGYITGAILPVDSGIVAG
jgi:NAD(P)-dependent dehydrogenase (short-subunit alcohol dehydrogenase family)